MNQVNGIVTKVKSAPFEKLGKWRVVVLYAAWGTESTRELEFDTEAEAAAVRVGYTFIA